METSNSQRESTEEDLDYQKISLETSLIAWKELQRFFANGSTIFVSRALDLTEVAHTMSRDDKKQVEAWLHSKEIALVSDEQALQWYEMENQLWAVVVKPWVLVQEQDPQSK